MTEYTVGLRLGKRSEVLTIEAEDALIAAPFGNPIGGAIVAIRIGRNEDCEARRPMSASGGTKQTCRSILAMSVVG